MIAPKEKLLDPSSIKARFDISDADLEQIRSFCPRALTHIDGFIEDFYRWLPTLPEFSHFFSEAKMIPSVKSQQREYWRVFFHARMDQKFFENRLTVGKTHARINLQVNLFIVHK